MTGLPAPSLGIPASTATVRVSIIDTTAIIRGITVATYVEKPIQGHEWLATPCIAFLIQHPGLNRSLLFDHGIRRDWWNASPSILQEFRDDGSQIAVTKDVRQILEDGGVTADSIEAIVWSHYHFDHIGDPARFGPGTAIVVGPGFKKEFLPGYPADPESPILESDYIGRELREIDFHGESALRVGRFRAYDYFGDGSFYLLDAPGHTVAHLCGLARVTSSPDSFIMMGADAASHGAEIRPSRYFPLPKSVAPHPFEPMAPPPCPGDMFEKLLRKSDRSIPFYNLPADAPHEDAAAFVATVDGLQDVDAHDNVLVVLAHDETVLEVVDQFPATANDFMEKGWVKKTRWRFLRDFALAVGWDGPVERGRDWAPMVDTK